MSAYKYFKGINAFTTIDDIKAQYRALAIANHPDMGGSVEAMAEINAEFADLCKRYGSVHKAANGSTYETEETERPEEFISIIDALIRLGVDIKIVGAWIWVSGNTYECKEELKAMGFCWSAKHKEWYKAPANAKYRRTNKSMKQIEAKYGIQYEHKANRAGIVAA